MKYITIQEYVKIHKLDLYLHIKEANLEDWNAIKNPSPSDSLAGKYIEINHRV